MATNTVQKHPDITLSRVEKFFAKSAYSQINLCAALFKQTLSDNQIELDVYSVPGVSQAKFKDVLSDAIFTPVNVGKSFGPLWSTHWFRVTFIVPECMHGECIELEWHAGGAECAVYLTNDPVQAVGISEEYNHTNYIISHRANKGEKHVLYIEAAINNIHMVPDEQQTCRLESMRIVVRNKEAFEIYYRMEALVGIARTLGHQTYYGAQALYTANAMVNAYQLDHLKSSLATMKHLSESFFQPQNNETTGRHTISTNVTNKSLQNNLQPTVYAIGHCHIDTAWLWPYEETHRKCARSWATQCQLMTLYPHHKFACSQAQQYAWVEKDYPHLFKKIQEMAQSGQFIPVGGSWVEMDTNLPCGEALTRQFLYGQAYFLEKFKKKCTVFWLPDTFGYCVQLPQLAVSAGMSYFMSQKLSWNNINRFPHSSFYWASLDHHYRLLTHFPPSDTYNSMGTVSDIMKSITNLKDLDRTNSAMLVFGFGDGGGGPQQDMVERLETSRLLPHCVPQVKVADPLEFFEDLEKKNGASLLTWYGELYFEFHRGTYTTHGYVKRMNRRCEQWLRDNEIFYTFIKDKETLCLLRSLWKTVLLNQFHDVLPGTSIALAYKEVISLYHQVRDVSLSLLSKALEKHPHSCETQQSEKTIHVLNLTSFPRNQVVALTDDLNRYPSVMSFSKKAINKSEGGALQYCHATNQPLVHLIDIPPWSSRSVSIGTDTLEACDIRHDSQCDTYILSNAYISVTVNNHGEIIVLYDKVADRKVITKCANRFVLYDDVPLFWDAWDVEVYYAEKEIATDTNKTEICIKETGPLRVALQVRHSIGDFCEIVQTIFLTCANQLIEFETHVPVWKANRRLLRVEFPVEIQDTVARYDTQYGHISRPTHGNTSWDVAKFEVCGHRYADLSEHNYGISLLSDSKYGFSCKGSVLGMSLLRAPKMPDPSCDMTTNGDFNGQEQHRFRYGLYPHIGHFHRCAKDILAQATHFNSPVYVTKSPCVPATLLTCQSDSVVVDTIKMAESVLDNVENNVVIVRAYEALGCHTKASLSIQCFTVEKAFLCTILEENETPLALVDGCIILGDIRPFQILTIKLYVSPM